MSELTANDFDAYFREVHGHVPYPWQSRLTRRVLSERGWPEVISLPTGTGKTSVLDTALFTLAARPDASPRRVIFVIDRRIVVDQVYSRATRIRDQIMRAESGVLARVRRRLGNLTDAQESLGVAALRGGIPIDGEWAHYPEQPWVIVSTIDQFGSRLLFRGYGVSQGMWPVHAGLAGNDCLVILDEVHLSKAFASTLTDVSSNGEVPLIHSVNQELLPRRFTVVEMSATPPDDATDQFRLEREDTENSARLARIVEARKRIELESIKGTTPAHVSVPKQTLKILRTIRPEVEKCVGVVTNRVRTARETYAAVAAKGYEAHLITGRMRPVDRQIAVDRISKHLDPDRLASSSSLGDNQKVDGPPKGNRSSSKRPDKPIVVVATQAIEVGADFSFDAMITEVAPIDSLLQRFGRLDRRGLLSAAEGYSRCWIFGVASALKPKKPDPVYGHAARQTWVDLQTLANNDPILVRPGANLVDQCSPEARAPKQDAPLLLPTHVESWTQTNPVPVVDPGITEFLHGMQSEHEPEISVVWRRDLSFDVLKLVPPRPVEMLSVPISAVKHWLLNKDEVPIADVDLAVSSGNGESAQRSIPQQSTGAIKWRGQGQTTPAELVSVDDITPGDVIVIPCDWGGLSGGTWDPTLAPTNRDGLQDEDHRPLSVEDLGDRAQYEYRRRVTLRLDPELLPSLSTPPNPADEVDATEGTKDRIDNWLKSLLTGELPQWMREVVQRFEQSSYRVHAIESEGTDGYYVLTENTVDIRVLDLHDDAVSDTGTGVSLNDHLSGVGRRAARFGELLGMSPSIVADLKLAGELHDLGKVDSRFQAQMHGQDEIRIAESNLEDRWLAKSLPGARTDPRRWPALRHEFGSVALVASNPEVLKHANDPDLVLHLVGTHHGHARPLPFIRRDPIPEYLTVEGQFNEDGFCLNGSSDKSPADPDVTPGVIKMTSTTDLVKTPMAIELADRFWRLQERYGHHGLAWLEATFRLADHRQSAAESSLEKQDG